MPKAQKIVKLKAEMTKSEDSGWHYLLINRETVAKFGFKDKFRRILCSVNGGESFHCALLPWGEQFYIIVNKKKRDEAGVAAGDICSVVLEKDESKYGLPMPEDFAEILNQDPDGDRVFHSLTAGKQRSLLYHLSNVKDIDARIHKGLVIVEHLKENGKVIDSKLYEELKRPAF